MQRKQALDQWVWGGVFVALVVGAVMLITMAVSQAGSQDLAAQNTHAIERVDTRLQRVESNVGKIDSDLTTGLERQLKMRVQVNDLATEMRETTERLDRTQDSINKILERTKL